MDWGRQVTVARFSLIERSGATKKGPINHEFVNLAAEFANISRTVIGKSDWVAKSRDRAQASREPRSIKYPMLVLAHSSGLRGWPKEGQVGSQREIQRAIRRCQDWIIRTDSFRFAAIWTSWRLKSCPFNFELNALSSTRKMTFLQFCFFIRWTSFSRRKMG